MRPSRRAEDKILHGTNRSPCSRLEDLYDKKMNVGDGDFVVEDVLPIAKGVGGNG